ncbi:MAG: methyltransferase domain-containing protein [Candidatus Obscuribacterales bacterium]|nr:methyltransferase domain-containing protein [Candidatus Obscuribacterales bacterium]
MNRDRLLLLTCGAILMLTQYICVREIGSTFFSTEIVTLLSVIMILIGPSIAYSMSERVSQRGLLLWAALSFVALMLVPFGIRMAVTMMKIWHLELLAMVAVLIFGSLFFSAFFAVFLPRLASGEENFRLLYSLELLGSVLALLLLTVIGSWQNLVTAFYLLLVLCLHLAFGKKLLTGTALILALVGAYYYPSLDAAAATRYYQVYWDKENPRILETHYSPYQRVDVVEDDRGKALYLDGVPYYEWGDLHWFNYYIAELPGRLVSHDSKARALVVGSGTLSSSGYLVRQGYQVTTVDIDRVVADLGLKYFGELNQLNQFKHGDSKKFELVIDDARRYIRSVPDRSCDLIVLDIPAPYHIQTALLYVPSFLKELKRCLKPGGIVSINTCSYQLDDRIAASIARGATEVFEDVSSIQGDSLGLTILYCSDRLPFSMRSLRSEASKSEKDRFSIMDNQALRFAVRGVKAHTEENLCALLLLSRYEFPELKKWL